jgi:outer membrane protein assembly factor BamB
MTFRISIIVPLIAIGLSAAEPAQWPQYRGSQGAGVAATAGPLQFGPKQNLQWQIEVPRGHSSPSIWGDHLFLTSFDPKANKLELLAIDRKNGRLRWRQTIPATEIEKVHEVSSPATATPIVDGERVYSYFGSAGLFCHDLDGKLIWSVPLPVAKASFGSGASPVLTGDRILIPRDDAGERRMVAVDKKTGKTLWTKDLGGGPRGDLSGHATPVVWKDQVVLHRAGEIAGYAVSDGSRQWWLQTGSQGTGTPVISNDMLIVGAWGMEAELQDPIPDWQTLLQKYDKNDDKGLSKDEFPDDLAALRRIDAGATPGAVITFKRFFDMLDGNKDGQIKQPEWEMVLKFITQPPPLAHGVMAVRLGGEQDVTKTNVLWSQERAVPEVPVPLVYKDRVYTVTNGGIVSALDAKTGKLIYRGRLGAGGLYYASPIAAGDRVYFASGDGVITVIQATGDTLQILARNDLAEPIFATSSIVDGKMYVRTTDHLYAFNSGR